MDSAERVGARHAGTFEPPAVDTLRERRAGVRPAPCVRIFVDTVTFDRGIDGCEELEVPLIELSFDYDGVRVGSRDVADRVVVSKGGALSAWPRARELESRARYVLESFGAVEVDCLEQAAVAPDCPADYLVRLEGDVHSYCGFTAYVVPQLRKLGFQVEIEPDFPYQTVTGEVSWYASVEPDEEKPDWFGLELGVELDGQRINLLPALLELLDKSSEEDTFESLARKSTRCVAIPIGQNRYLPVPPERVRSLLRVVMELYRGPSEPFQLTFPKSLAPVLTRIDGAFDGGRSITWRCDASVREWAERLASPSNDVVSPHGLRATLRPYQEEGLRFLQHLRACGVGGILADDMGLGKTLQTIAHISSEKAAGRLAKPCLVVSPTSLVFNWQREIEKFAPHLRVLALHGGGRHARYDEISASDVVVTSYPILVRDEERFAAHEFHLVILDEAHTIKNTRSLVHKAARKLNGEHRVCLTGTPVENHLGELWALFDFLNPGMLGDAERFNGWYRLPIERYGDEERLAALRQQLAPYIVRRLKSEVAKDLPPKTELMRPVELQGKQRELYEAIRIAAHAEVRQTIRKKGFAASQMSILDALMKLRQLCCDPRLLKMEAARFVRESTKYDLLFELLEKQLEQGHRPLVFSQFTSMLGLISKGLAERKIAHVALTGATPDRGAVVDAFESGKVDVFLISLKAGGTGLTLTSADTVIHYDPWWNPAAQAQATDRAYRIGQTKPVFVYNLFVAGSVEERMFMLQKRKRSLADAILAAGAHSERLTEEDLDVLFAPLG